MADVRPHGQIDSFHVQSLCCSRTPDPTAMFLARMPRDRQRFGSWTRSVTCLNCGRKLFNVSLILLFTRRRSSFARNPPLFFITETFPLRPL
jgi:hypothetical protein